MTESLQKIKISCNDCSNDQYFDYETLRSMADSEVNLTNLNLIIDSFNCNSCGSLNLSIFDIDDRMLFDRGNDILCTICSLSIPLPRIQAQPGTNKCISCKDELESEYDIPPEIIFPDVPEEKKGECPNCRIKGRTGSSVVVRQNRYTEDFFLGCSLFPNCRWTNNQFYDQLN